MSRIRSSSGWTRQPQYPTSINSSNPLTSGLIAAPSTISAQLNDPLGNSWTLGGSGDLANSISANGVGQLFASASGQYKTAPIKSPLPGNGATIACWFMFSSNAAASAIIAMSPASGGSDRLQLMNNGSGGLTAGVVNSAGANTNTIAGVSFATGTWQFGIARYNGATIDCFCSGVKVSVAATGTLLPAQMYVGARLNSTVGYFFDGAVAAPMFWNRALSDVEIASLVANPWQIYAPITLKLRVGVIAAGGAVSISEITTGADSVSCWVTYSIIQSEAGSASATPTVVSYSIESISEAITSADTQTASVAFAVADAEAASAVDAQTQTIALAAADTEAGSAADALTALNSSVEAVTETGSVTDAPTAVNSSVEPITETASGADTQTGASSAAAASTEVGTGIDATNATSGGGVQAAVEAATGTDSPAAVNSAVLSASETATGTDTPTATTGAIQNAAENASATDSETVISSLVIALAEAATAADIGSVTAVSVATVTEPASGADTPSVVSMAVASGTEAASGTDASTVFKAINTSLAETVAALDSAAASATFVGSLAEAVSALDSGAVTAVFFSAVAESSAATGIAAAIQLVTAALTEAANAADVWTVLLTHTTLIPPHIFVRSTSNGVFVMTLREHTAVQSAVQRVAVLSSVAKTASTSKT